MTGFDHHRDRRRAESFGAGADAYDRHRPPYADALADQLAALRPAAVLDVGCGNGRASAGLRARGLDVLGVEPDERMAAVARARGLRVEIGSFEEWDDRGRRFDLLVCGAAWHWIEPVRGVAKAAAVLRPGGTLARVWNYPVLDGSVRDRLERVYDDLGVAADAHGREPSPLTEDPVADDPAFGEVTVSTARERQVWTTDGWLALLATFSDHATLDPDDRAELFDGLRAAVDGIGGSVPGVSCTHALICRRV